MSVTSSSPTWSPKTDPGRPADTTANIHRALAWMYGVLGAFFTAFAVLADQAHVALIIGLIFAAVVGLHVALCVGASNRSDIAKTGSIIVGVLMLAGFPIGTVTGGFLIYYASKDWPPKRDPLAFIVGADMRDL